MSTRLAEAVSGDAVLVFRSNDLMALLPQAGQRRTDAVGLPTRRFRELGDGGARGPPQEAFYFRLLGLTPARPGALGMGMVPGRLGINASSIGI